MGAFLKIFIGILCINVLLIIVFPGSETQFIKDDFFNEILVEEVNPATNESEYTNLNNNIKPEWSEGGNQDSNFLTKFIDGLSVIKSFAILIVNMAVLPITISIKMQVPLIVRLLLLIPLAIIYALSAVLTIIRGVQA